MHFIVSAIATLHINYEEMMKNRLSFDDKFI